MKYLKDGGFDWHNENYDHDKDKDLLCILFNGSVISNFNETFQKAFQGKDSIVIEIQRKYSGG